MPEVLAYATDDHNAEFHRTTITRREPGPTEVYFEIKYAGICHSDIHTARAEWGPAIYPLVPGHEIVGIVTKIGDQVTSHEQFCTTKPYTIWTYNSIGRDGLPTAGGYSQAITVEQDYVIRIPDEIPFDKAAPLLCAGITLYSPLKRWGAGPGKKVAIIGMGGLGHVGVQIAAKMGAEVVVISQTMGKKDDGLRFGASDYYATSEPERLRELRGSLDLMVSTVAAVADLDAMLKLLKPGGVLVDVGLPEHASTLRLSSLTSGNKVLAGSQIGGIAETQEVLDFCAANGVVPQVEIISGEDITAAYDKVVHSQVRYRYVIDTSTF